MERQFLLRQKMSKKDFKNWYYDLKRLNSDITKFVTEERTGTWKNNEPSFEYEELLLFYKNDNHIGTYSITHEEVWVFSESELKETYGNDSTVKLPNIFNNAGLLIY